MPEKKRKPRIGQKVYVVYMGSITPTIVGWLGKDSWVPEDFDELYDGCQVMEYENEKDLTSTMTATWYYTLKKAKAALRKLEPDCKKIIFNRWFWEAVYE